MLLGGLNMKNKHISAIVAASLAVSMPATAAADAGDFIAGGIVGALITKGITDNQRAKKQAQPRRSYKSSGSSVSSLNGQYSRAERIQIQTAFRDLGYDIGTVDGVLGKRSRAVIRQFQASRGEAQTGQLTRPQYVALLSQAPGVNPVYARRELSRDEVVMLQQGLQTLGYYGGLIDGANGPGTIGARNAFLANSGTNPAMVTPVQALVMARNAAGLPTPPYLQREAGSQVAPVQPFGTQQAGFGQAGQQPVAPFGAQAPQVSASGFARQGMAPAPGQGQYPPQQGQYGAPVQQQPATTTTTLFGAPAAQPGQVVPQQGQEAPQQNLFAPAAPQQQPTPQPVVPQGGQAGTLFATGTPAVPAPAQQQVSQQSAPSSLDIYSGTTQSPSNQVANQANPLD